MVIFFTELLPTKLKECFSCTRPKPPPRDQYISIPETATPRRRSSNQSPGGLDVHVVQRVTVSQDQRPAPVRRPSGSQEQKYAAEEARGPVSNEPPDQQSSAKRETTNGVKPPRQKTRKPPPHHSKPPHLPPLSDDPITPYRKLSSRGTSSWQDVVPSLSSNSEGWHPSSTVPRTALVAPPPPPPPVPLPPCPDLFLMPPSEDADFSDPLPPPPSLPDPPPPPAAAADPQGKSAPTEDPAPWWNKYIAMGASEQPLYLNPGKVLAPPPDTVPNDVFNFRNRAMTIFLVSLIFFAETVLLLPRVSYHHLRDFLGFSLVVSILLIMYSCAMHDLQVANVLWCVALLMLQATLTTTGTEIAFIAAGLFSLIFCIQVCVCLFPSARPFSLPSRDTLTPFLFSP